MDTPMSPTSQDRGLLLAMKFNRGLVPASHALLVLVAHLEQDADVFQTQLRPLKCLLHVQDRCPHVPPARLVREQTANCIKDLNALRAEAQTLNPSQAVCSLLNSLSVPRGPSLRRLLNPAARCFGHFSTFPIFSVKQVMTLKSDQESQRLSTALVAA